MELQMRMVMKNGGALIRQWERGRSTREAWEHWEKRHPSHQGGKIPKNVAGPYLPKEDDDRPQSRTQGDPPCLSQ